MKQYHLQPGFFDRKRKLNLDPDYIEFENKDLRGQEFTRFNKTDIIDFKQEIEGIVWYKFTVGRLFKITLKNQFQAELKISFKSYFGLKEDYQNLYSEIIKDIWHFYHKAIVDQHLDAFYSNQDLAFKGLILNQNGIELRGANQKLGWNEISIKDYQTYFVIHKTGNPTIHWNISSNEYESETLWSVVRTILKGIEMNDPQKT